MREVKEETGVSVDRESVRIASTQAWPTSRTGTCVLMVGAVAEGASSCFFFLFSDVPRSDPIFSGSMFLMQPLVLKFQWTLQK